MTIMGPLADGGASEWASKITTSKNFDKVEVRIFAITNTLSPCPVDSKMYRVTNLVTCYPLCNIHSSQSSTNKDV